jgi:hypothetical protein
MCTYSVIWYLTLQLYGVRDRILMDETLRLTKKCDGHDTNTELKTHNELKWRTWSFTSFLGKMLQLLGSTRFRKCLVTSCFIDTTLFFLYNHTCQSWQCLLLSLLNTIFLLPIIPSALLPLTLQEDNSSNYPLVTGQTRGFTSQKISLNFHMEKQLPTT